MSKSEEIKQKMVDCHAAIQKSRTDHGAGPNATPGLLVHHAMIVDLAAQLAEESSLRLEKQTQTLIRLTWGLLFLTIVLAGLTFALLVVGK